MGCGLEGGQKEEGGRAGEPGGPQSWATVRALEGSRQNGLVLLLQAGPAASHHGFHLGTCQKCRLTESQSAAFQGPQVIQMHIRIGDARETTGYLPITKQSLTFTHQGAVVRLGLSVQPHTSPGEYLYRHCFSMEKQKLGKVWPFAQLESSGGGIQTLDS